MKKLSTAQRKARSVAKVCNSAGAGLSDAGRAKAVKACWRKAGYPKK